MSFLAAVWKPLKKVDRFSRIHIEDLHSQVSEVLKLMLSETDVDLIAE